uniref:BAG domain-containing protein n=1 Tax=Hyaloperonospora arabidopsidis (strain Emoy2) TaxID=559515 RepID=M4BQR8_HYAAE
MELQKTQTQFQPMNEQNRLQTISEKVKNVQETLNERLSAQYRHVLATVCGSKWRLQALRSLDAAAVVKKTRIELGAFDYRVKEQAELLTRYLLELDDVLSYGDVEIKSARKALVVFLQQQLLPQADAWKDRSAKLKRFGEIVLSRVRPMKREEETLGERRSDVESDDVHVKRVFHREGDDEGREGGEKDKEEDEDEEEEGEVEDSDEGVEDEEEVMNGVEDFMEGDAFDGSGVPVKTEADKKEAPQSSPRLESSALTSPGPDVSVESLPVWRPYYQLQRRQDGVYLIARLNNIDPRNLRVQWNEHSGVLRVSGFRLPTQKDMVMSRLSGAPTFGRFEITEQFPRNMLNMEEATQQISENGILQIRMPYYAARHPLQYHPASFYQPQDCFVW